MHDELEQELEYNPWEEDVSPPASTRTTSQSLNVPDRKKQNTTRTDIGATPADSHIRFDNVLSVWDMILARTGQPEHPTYIEKLDRVIWGLHRKEITIIGGRPGQGKTSLAVQLALAAAEKAKVLYYSLEMSREQIIERLISHMARLDNQVLRQGAPSLGGNTQRVKEIAGELQTLDLHLLDDRGHKIGHYVEDAKTYSPAFMFLDYIQLTQGINTYQKRHEQIADILALFKRLCKTYNVGIVICSQLNRTGELKSSGSLEEVADTIIELDWEGQSGAIDGTGGDYWIRVTKQRHGPIADIKLCYLPEQYRFIEL